MAAGAKSQLHDLIGAGDVDIVNGTHALIQEGVAFDNLGFAVVDEQHRFGVEQRASLRNKGFAPHLLVMTATPIPRTMALAIYGDLDVSTIHEMPPGRPPIRTAIVLRTSANGHTDSFAERREKDGNHSSSARWSRNPKPWLPRRRWPSMNAYARGLSDLNVGLLHGRMRPAEKDRVMEALHGGDVDVLVSTRLWKLASTCQTRR